MFIAKLMQFNRQNVNETKTVIIPKPFVDLLLDATGWYAVGHHDQKKFLAAVIKEEKYPYTHWRSQHVKLAWAKFEGNNFELIEQHSKDAQPITLIEDLGTILDQF